MAERQAGMSAGRLAQGLGIQAVLLTTAGAAMWHFSGRELGNFVDFGWLPIVQGIAFGGTMIALAASLFKLFPGFLERTTHLQSKMAALFSRQTGWRVYVWIALCAGIGEEAFFRGGVFTLAADRFGAAAAVAISAAGFALIHLARPLIILLILLVGVVFGLVYWWTGSLLTVIIGHAVYDIWALHMLHRELTRLGYFDRKEPDAT